MLQHLYLTGKPSNRNQQLQWWNSTRASVSCITCNCRIHTHTHTHTRYYCVIVIKLFRIILEYPASEPEHGGQSSITVQVI
jgi:hypothetical protein